MSDDSYGPLQPGAVFTALIGGPTDEVGAYDPSYPGPGLTGKLGISIVPLAGGTPILARTTTGVQEQAPGSAIYAVDLTAPTPTGSYTVLWSTVNPAASWGQVLAVDTSVPVTPPTGSSITPVYLTQADLAADPTLIPGLAISDPAAFDVLLVRCEQEIDSILGTWVRDPTTGRKVDVEDIVPVAPISPFPGELFAPYIRGVTIFQKAALQRAVAAQVEYHLVKGEDFFLTTPRTSVSGPQFSYSYGTNGGGPSHISPRALAELNGMGLIRQIARLTI